MSKELLMKQLRLLIIGIALLALHNHISAVYLHFTISGFPIHGVAIDVPGTATIYEIKKAIGTRWGIHIDPRYITLLNYGDPISSGLTAEEISTQDLRPAIKFTSDIPADVLAALNKKFQDIATAAGLERAAAMPTFSPEQNREISSALADLKANIDKFETRLRAIGFKP